MVTSGFNDTNNDFGNFKLGTTSGYKFNDVNGDGTWDTDQDVPEPGLEDWTITLYKETNENDGLQIADSGGDEYQAYDRTDDTGMYEFGGLTVGTYYIIESCPDNGWVQTYPGTDETEATCGDGVQTITVTTSGTVLTDKNFGNFKLGTSEGFKFEDENGNGVWDVEETDVPEIALEDWDISLWAEDNDTSGLQTTGGSPDSKVTTIPTAADGKYSFTGLKVGTYYVVEECPVGWVQTLPNTDENLTSCDFYTIEVTSGSVERRDFGNQRIPIPTLDKDAIPAPGTAVEAGEKITYTITVKNDGALDLTGQELVDTLPPNVTYNKDAVPAVNSPDTAPQGGKLTWTFDIDAFSTKTFTYSVTVNSDVTTTTPDQVNTADWTAKYRGKEIVLTDNTVHPIKAITASTTGFCVKDAPYYSVTVTSKNLPDANGQVTFRWYQANAQGQPIDAQGNPTTDPTKYVAAYNPAIGTPAGNYVDTYPLSGGKLSIPQILWKGAQVDANGSATVWPGWSQPSPGVWVQVNSGGVRPGMFAVVTVNPTAQTAAIYPPAASPCANPPGVPKLDKTANPTEGTTVAIGQTINYSILVTNTGGSTFTGPMVDTLPAGVTVNGTISDGGVLNGNTITWQVTLEAGASKTFTYPVLVVDRRPRATSSTPSS